MAQDRAKESDERRPTAGDLVIRWGLIAGGIATIIGLGVLVWDLVNPNPPPKLDARFEQVAIESGVTFGDFRGQLKVAAAGVPQLALAALQVDETATPSPTGSPTTTATATATSSATVSPTATSTATIDPAARGVQVQSSEKPGEIMLTPVNAAHGRPSAVALPSGCRFAEEGGKIVCDGQLSLTWATKTQSAQPDEEQAVVSVETLHPRAARHASPDHRATRQAHHRAAGHRRDRRRRRRGLPRQAGGGRLVAAPGELGPGQHARVACQPAGAPPDARGELATDLGGLLGAAAAQPHAVIHPHRDLRPTGQPLDLPGHQHFR